MPQVPKRNDHRRAMTLVELLTVIFILIMLMASALPLARMALADRKIASATRQLATFIQGIQARAAGSNTPMGIWIERDPQNPMGSYQVFAAIVPQPYAGDWLGATALLVDEDSNGIADAADFLISECGSLHPNIFPYLRLVRAGDWIRFGYSGAEYVLTTDVFPAANSPLKPRSPDPQRGAFVRLRFRHPEARFGVNNLMMVHTPVRLPASGSVLAGVPFQILRAPQKSSIKPLQLPEGIVIDLSNSGIGLPTNDPAWPVLHPDTRLLLRPGKGQEFAPDLLRTNLYANDGLSNLDIYQDVYNTDPSGTPTGLVRGDQRPVVIMFEPNGAIRSVSCSRLGGNFRPSDNLHLLVGRTEQLNIASAYAPNGLRYSMHNNAPPQWFINQNLSDTANRWVSISPRTGAVTSSENGWVLNSDTSAGVFSYTGSVQACRQYAQDAQSSTLGR